MVAQTLEGADSKSFKPTSRAEESIGDVAAIRLIENFAVMAEITGGVEHLKTLVLQLAIRGRLTSPMDSDEPATLLLERLKEERIASRGQGSKFTAPVEPPFQIPRSWTWARLDQLLRSITDGDHQPPPKSEHGVAFLTIGNLSKGKLDFNSPRYVAEPYFSGLDALRVPGNGDLLYTVVGSFGIPVFVDTDRPFCVQRHIAILKPLPSTSVAFLRLLLESDFVYQQAAAGATGIAQPTVGLGVLRSFVVPVPPLAEQQRIVAKVDQLMALCADLEARQTKKREIGTRLTKSALEALTTAESPAEFDAAWKRVFENFDVLFCKSTDIAALRAGVLELATRGVIEPQAVAEGTGRSLLQRTVVARNALKPGSTTDDTLATATLPVSHPIPVTWAWASLEALTHPVRLIRYGMLMPGPDRPDGPLYVKVRNMKNGVINVEGLPRTTSAIYDKYAGAALGRGDLLMSIRGSFGGVALVPDEIDGANITQDSARIAPMEGVNRKYLLFVLRSPMCQQYFSSIAKGAAVQGLNIGDIRRTPIPLPPLAEQKRIVETVERFMALCDDLEAKLRRAEDRAAKLVEAAVRELVA